LRDFLNRDPIDYKGGPNLYAFCDGNPVNEIDPEGTDPTDPSGFSNLNAQQFLQIQITTPDIQQSWTGFQDTATYKGIMGSYDFLTSLPIPEDPIFDYRLGSAAVADVAEHAPELATLAEPLENVVVKDYYILSKELSDTVNQAHHTIQHAAVRDLPGYSKDAAPATSLRGAGGDSPHGLTRPIQRQPGGGTYGAERRIGYKALRSAGLTRVQARSAVEQSDKYFEGIGVTQSTPTRIPLDRR